MINIQRKIVIFALLTSILVWSTATTFAADNSDLERLNAELDDANRQYSAYQYQYQTVYVVGTVFNYNGDSLYLYPADILISGEWGTKTFSCVKVLDPEPKYILPYEYGTGYFYNAGVKGLNYLIAVESTILTGEEVPLYIISSINPNSDNINYWRDRANTLQAEIDNIQRQINKPRIVVKAPEERLIENGQYNLNHQYWSLAVDNFTSAIQVNPNSYDAYFGRGATYYLWGKDYYEKALSDFNKAIELFPAHYKAHHFKGKIYAERGQYFKAMDELMLAVRDNNIEPFYEMALIYDPWKGPTNKNIAQDAKGLAIKAYESYIQFSPSNSNDPKVAHAKRRLLELKTVKSS